MKTILLDSSAFIAGIEIGEGEVKSFTVPSVIIEIEKNPLLRLRIQVATNSGRLLVTSPEPKYVSEIEGISKTLGEAGFLSTPDKELLALALQFKKEDKDPIIFSDDFSIQNIAEYLSIKYFSASTRGIEKALKWAIYCPGCKRTFDKLDESRLCPICGTGLKRRPLKKSNIKSKLK